MPRNLFYSTGEQVKFSNSGERRLENLIRDFDQFLVDKENSFIQLEGYSRIGGNAVTSSIPVIYSCDPSYRRQQMAKLYKLNDWYNKLPPNARIITMITLTTYQRGYDSFFDQYAYLRDSWIKLKDVMRKDMGKFEYLVVAEPHKSGFAHYHILIFKLITQRQASHYKELWANKYSAGSSDNGIDIKVTMNGALRSIKNYLMKYLAKTFTLTYTDAPGGSEYFNGSDLQKHEIILSEANEARKKAMAQMSASAAEESKSYFLKVFHATKWGMCRRDTDYKGFRSFQPSRFLSMIMRLDKKEGSGVVWTAAFFVYWGEKRLLWSNGSVFSMLGEAFSCSLPPLDRNRSIMETVIVEGVKIRARR